MWAISNFLQQLLDSMSSCSSVLFDEFILVFYGLTNICIRE
jgi:hypothetical protein